MSKFKAQKNQRKTTHKYFRIYTVVSRTSLELFKGSEQSLHQLGPRFVLVIVSGQKMTICSLLCGIFPCFSLLTFWSKIFNLSNLENTFERQSQLEVINIIGRYCDGNKQSSIDRKDTIYLFRGTATVSLHEIGYSLAIGILTVMTRFSLERVSLVKTNFD